MRLLIQKWNCHQVTVSTDYNLIHWTANVSMFIQHHNSSFRRAEQIDQFGTCHVRYIPFRFQKVCVRYHVTTSVHVKFGTWPSPFRYRVPSFSVPRPVWYTTNAISACVINCNAERITFYNVHAFIIHQCNIGLLLVSRSKAFFWPTL